jgi:hypothetical protein
MFSKFLYGDFEDTKGLIRSCNLKDNRQYNAQKKKKELKDKQR